MGPRAWSYASGSARAETTLRSSSSKGWSAPGWDRGPDPLVLAATRRLGFPGSRVEWLADALGISDRQLRRRFHRFVGYGPKTLDRILRFRRLVSQSPAIRSGDGDLARLAAELGYADQAHMTRDCVALSGLTPGRLAATWAT